MRPGAHRQTLADPFEGHGRFPAQPQRRRHFHRVAFRMAAQIFLAPAFRLQPFPHQTFRTLFVGFVAFARQFVPPPGAPQPLRQPLREIRGAQFPAAPKGSPLIRRFAFPASVFRALLQLNAPSGRVGLNAMRRCRIWFAYVSPIVGAVRESSNLERGAAPGTSGCPADD